MTADENNTTLLHTLASAWHKVRSNRIVSAIIWLKWVITVGGFLATVLWYAYLEGQDISGNLTSDYKAVQEAQQTLLDDSLVLQQQLLNPKVTIDLDNELAELRSKSRMALGALSGLRAPTDAIAQAQKEYRVSLEQLIAVTNRLERGEVHGMEVDFHNGLQSVSNAGGNFNLAVRDFQGGMWPQLIGSIF